jgi:hypothetical protein
MRGGLWDVQKGEGDAAKWAFAAKWAKWAFTALPDCDKLLRAENTILKNVTRECVLGDAFVQGTMNNA